MPELAGAQEPARAKAPSAGSSSAPRRGRAQFCGISTKFAIAAAALLFHSSGALWTANNVPFPSHIDELQHMSYVQAMAEAPTLFPRFDQMRTLDSTLGALTQNANYLNHPSPYYHLMALADDPGQSAAARVWDLRLANLALSSLGVILMLGGGMVLLPEVGAFGLFATVLVMFPKMAVVGGLVNNDNLAILAAGLFFLGLAWLHKYDGNRDGMGAGVLVGLGIALAGWAKLTVFIMVGAVFIASVLLLLRKKEMNDLPSALVIASVIGLFGFVPTIENFITHASPLYMDRNPTPEGTTVLSFFEYGPLFLRELALEWPAIHRANAIHLAGLAGALGAFLMIMLMELQSKPQLSSGSLFPDRRGGDTPIAGAYGLGFVTSLTVHLVYAWLRFQDIGGLSAAQPRYYYALWPGFALAVVYALRRLPPGRQRGYACICLGALMASNTIQFGAASASLWGPPLVPH